MKRGLSQIEIDATYIPLPEQKKKVEVLLSLAKANDHYLMTTSHTATERKAVDLLIRKIQDHIDVGQIDALSMTRSF